MNLFADVLKTEFGAACREFKTEDEYLLGLLKHVRGIKRNPREYLDEWNLLDTTDVKMFKMNLRHISDYIERTMNTPLEDRGKRYFCFRN